MKKSVCLLFVLTFLFISSFAQNKTDNKRAKKFFLQALYFIDKGDTLNAIKYAQKATKVDTLYTEPYILIAQINTQNKKFNISNQYYKKAIATAPNYSLLYRLISLNYIQTEQFDSAIFFLQIFLKFDNDRELVDDAIKKIDICRFRKLQIENPLNIIPIRLDTAINSTLNDYFPTISAENNTIIFTRLVNQQEDIYISRLIDNNWTKAKPITPVINTQFNEGAHSLSADGMEMYFTRCVPQSGCDIYYTYKDQSGFWMPPQPINEINTRYWETQPCISPDNQKLFFVSNRPGGKGKMDIWCSVRKNNKWTEPFNLGDSINTENNEMSPFLHFDNQTFYFASDGHIGMGGFDIFVSKIKNSNNFSTPINLGYPINDKQNQFRLVVDALGQNAYYSTETDKQYGQDIYKIQLPKQIQPTPTIYVKVRFFDFYTYNPINVSTIEVINLNNDDTVFTTNNKSYFLACLPKDNLYMLNAFAKDYIFYSDNFDLQNIETNIQNYEIDIYLKPLSKNLLINLKNIYYQTNSFVIEEKSYFELNNLVKFMQQNPNLKIQINGHTDSIGTYQYNIELSEKRAKAVAEYLISQGIPQNRITYKGYGYTQPVAENKTEEGRKLNRRTEILILEK